MPPKKNAPFSCPNPCPDNKPFCGRLGNCLVDNKANREKHFFIHNGQTYIGSLDVLQELNAQLGTNYQPVKMTKENPKPKKQQIEFTSPSNVATGSNIVFEAPKSCIESFNTETYESGKVCDPISGKLKTVNDFPLATHQLIAKNGNRILGNNKTLLDLQKSKGGELSPLERKDKQKTQVLTQKNNIIELDDDSDEIIIKKEPKNKPLSPQKIDIRRGCQRKEADQCPNDKPYCSAKTGNCISTLQTNHMIEIDGKKIYGAHETLTALSTAFNKPIQSLQKVQSSDKLIPSLGRKILPPTEASQDKLQTYTPQLSIKPVLRSREEVMKYFQECFKNK